MALLSRHSLIFLLSVFFVVTLSAQTTKGILRSEIDNIATKLRKENEVHFGYAVGFAGRPETNNKYYKLYLKLKDKATNEELIELTKSQSKIIFVYAFNILQSRNYDGLKNVFLDHITDTTWFWTAGGCTGVINRINWFMLWRLKPTSGNKTRNYLTKNEFDMYCSRFKKEDTLFSCD